MVASISTDAQWSVAIDFSRLGRLEVSLVSPRSLQGSNLCPVQLGPRAQGSSARLLLWSTAAAADFCVPRAALLILTSTALRTVD